MKSIGLDVGNGSTCIVVRGEKGKGVSRMYSTTYGLYDADKERSAMGSRRDDSNKIRPPVFSLNGREYVLGYEDIKAVGGQPISTYGREERIHLSAYHTMTKLALLDAATMDGQTGVIEVALGMGVPNEDYREDKLSEFKAWFKEPVTGTKNGEQVVVMVKYLEILSQPIAVLMDAYYDDEGFVKDEDIENQNVLVIDSGSGTLDMTEFRGTNLQKQVSEPIGMNDVYQVIIEGIEKRESKVRVDAYDLEFQLRQQDNSEEKVYQYGKLSLTITDIWQKAMDDAWENMVGRIERRHPDRMRFHRALLAGGTGDAFSGRFKAWMPQIQKTEKPQLAIARGLCKYAVSVAAEVTAETAADTEQ
jgi:plasmid segregation protein ParM